ncbi:MAG: hypothetical protein K0S30_96 [Clostridia bacterium]|jgi:LPXTG-motif cell wall-anchored protein|nr:hypothetical protein [Clostridia bacterium]
MKRRKSKWIGLTLILSAILLQVAYAAAVTVEGVASTADYAVQIESQAGEKSEYVELNVRTDDVKSGVVLVEVGNLYPGAYFTVDSTIKNLGNNIKLTSIEIKPNNNDSQKLYENLVFYDEQGKELKQDEYKKYLINVHEDGKLEKNETRVFRLKMGLSPEVTEFENTTASFLIEIIYEQDVADPGTGGGSGGGGSNSGRPDTPVETIVPEEPTEIIDELLPAGPVTTEITDETNIEVVDETIPGGDARLPKTGGVAALFVYAVGLTMLGGGISIYRKGKKEE